MNPVMYEIQTHHTQKVTELIHDQQLHSALLQH